MAKKKTEYDYTEAIAEMEIAEFIKPGFLYRIEEKNISIKSDKDLEKEFKKFWENK